MTPGEDQQAALTAITRGLGGLYKERFGQGPTRARGWFCGPDVVACVMEGTLTTKEQTMREAGHAPSIHDTRQMVEEVLEPAMREVVGKALGRGVGAVVSGLNAEADVASHVFLLQSDET